MSESYIILENISKTYPGKIVLDIDFFQILLNKIIVILGYSGSGKTTLINILSLLDIPDKVHYKTRKEPKITIKTINDTFEISYNTKQLKDEIIIKSIENNIKYSASEIRNIIFGYIFQEPYLHPNFNVENNIKTPLFINRTTIDQNDISELVNQIGLKGHAYKYINDVSGGEKQRIAILRGLIMQSPVIIGDELTSNIDYKRAITILDIIKQRVNEKKCSFIWVTHDVHLTAAFADIIITIKNGTLTWNENPKKESKILNLLKIEKHSNNNIKEIQYNKKKIGIRETINYFVSYAIMDLFKKVSNDKSIIKYKPTTDFWIGFISITFVLLFLLSIMKMGYATNEFLTAKLSDPRINNLRIKTSGYLAEGLSLQDVEKIKAETGMYLKHITPIYMANISIQKYKSKRKKFMHRNPYTFEANDPVINSIIKNKKPFLNSKTDYDGLIIKKDIFTKILNYPPDEQEVEITINRITKKVPVIVTEEPLPIDSFYLIRKQFYIDTFTNNIREKKPELVFILLYPKDIHYINNITSIIKKMEIEGTKLYEIVSASDIDNKLEVIDEIELLIGYFTIISCFAVLFISIAYIFITIYRNINKKRSEIGVFMAYGMKKSFFYIFYIIEALIIWLSTTLTSYVIYICTINPIINKNFTSGKFDKALDINPELLISIQNVQLDLPHEWIFILYSLSFYILISIFIFLVRNFIKNLPIKLMKVT